MSNKRLTQEYKERKLELIRRINLCKEAKENVTETVKKLNKNLDHNIISYEEYNNKLDSFLKNKSIKEWADYYDDSIRSYEKELENCESELIIRDAKLRSIITIILILFIIGIGIFYLNPSITGYIVASEPANNSIDKYQNDGVKWVEIRGEMMYARCIKLRSEIEFNSLKIKAKVTSATDQNNLIFGLYNNLNISDDPQEEIGKCRVRDYSSIWKSCTINNLNLYPDDYWICAYSESKGPESTYFTIGYNNVDNKKTALWTGNYWQKLENSSYTIEGEFIKW